MKKKLLIVTVLFAFTTFSYQLSAQFKRIGVKAGVNLTNVRISNSDFAELAGFSTFKQVVGANVGFLNQFSGNGVFVTDFGFSYSLKGCKEDSFMLRMNYLQIPLVFKIRIPIAGPVALQGGFGPYIAYSFLAKETYAGISNEDILSLRSKNEDSFLKAI